MIKYKEILWKAFLAGFMSSGEGWNGEYPFESHATPEHREAVKEDFETWFADPDRPDPRWQDK